MPVIDTIQHCDACQVRQDRIDELEKQLADATQERDAAYIYGFRELPDDACEAYLRGMEKAEPKAAGR
jgi:hypothetical protein